MSAREAGRGRSKYKVLLFPTLRAPASFQTELFTPLAAARPRQLEGCGVLLPELWSLVLFQGRVGVVHASG